MLCFGGRGYIIPILQCVLCALADNRLVNESKRRLAAVYSVEALKSMERFIPEIEPRVYSHGFYAQRYFNEAYYQHPKMLYRVKTIKENS